MLDTHSEGSAVHVRFFFFPPPEWGEYGVSGIFFSGGLDLGYNSMRIYNEGCGDAI